MKSFIGVASLILGIAAGVSGYEALTGGTLTGTNPPVVVAEGVTRQAAAQPISRTKTPRIATPRTVDIVTERPPRPAPLERMIEARGGSDFPILLPPAMTRDEQTLRDYKVRLKLLEDGYSAVMTTAEMDIVIYGTRTVFRRKAALQKELEAVKAERDARQQRPDITGAPQDAQADDVRPRVRAPYTMSFEESDDGRGGAISFGRYGVDYHIEFYCLAIEALDGANCIDEAGARGFVSQMGEDANDVQ